MSNCNVSLTHDMVLMVFPPTIQWLGVWTQPDCLGLSAGLTTLCFEEFVSLSVE